VGITQLIALAVLSFIVGMIVSRIIRILAGYLSVERRHMEHLRARYEMLRRQTIEEGRRTRYIVIPPDILEKLTKYTVLDVEELPAGISEALELSGFIERHRHGYLVNIEAVTRYVEAIRGLAPRGTYLDPEVSRHLLSRYGIMNIFIYEVSREEGLILRYVSSSTRLSDRINRDPGIIDNLFMLGENISTAEIDGSKIVVHYRDGYYIIAEITTTADPETVRRILEQVRISENLDQIRESLMNI